MSHTGSERWREVGGGLQWGPAHGESWRQSSEAMIYLYIYFFILFFFFNSKLLFRTFYWNSFKRDKAFILTRHLINILETNCSRLSCFVLLNVDVWAPRPPRLRAASPSSARGDEPASEGTMKQCVLVRDNAARCYDGSVSHKIGDISLVCRERDQQKGL